MKRVLTPLLAAGLLLAAAILVPALAGADGDLGRAEAELSGAQEVPAVATDATGEAEFRVVDPNLVVFELKVKGLGPVIQAHIHMAPQGENGDVVAFLFGPADPAVGLDQVEVNGTITNGNLIGPLAGMTIEDLGAAAEAGNLYVNVHTPDNPTGAIRGQVVVKG
jgi:hypothetical protein